jgi:oxygen-independent coproporphyrinogen-3 oxidase
VSRIQRTDDDGTSLYVHVPFCVVKCGYCDFTSYVVEDTSVHDTFLAALDAELALLPVPRHPTTVFVGGGTPSHLAPQRLEALFALLRRHVDLDACGEVTMEANPESIDRRKAEIALAAGVSRFSMGVQSFDAARLRFLDRAHSAECVVAAVGELRAAGVVNLSLDLIFGVPGQPLSAWEDDLERALALQPDHLSCYALTYEPGTRLTHELRAGRIARLGEEEERSMFLRTREVLHAAGFRAYEISNFAGRGGPCRHNDHYWLQGDYVGVGPGASSHRSGHRATNLKPIEAWAKSALARVPPVATAETLTPEQRVGEAIWLGIRRADGVDLARVGRRIGCDVRTALWPLLERHRARGWIELDGDTMRLTSEGLLFADAVGSDYLVGEPDAIQTPSDRR